MNRFSKILMGTTAALAIGAAVPSFAEDMHVVPPPAQDAKPASAPQTAVLSGGCFWGVQGVFEHVKGVTRVLAGYSGGAASTAQYETVSGGDTGHAESVQITYDPQKISYGKLLQIFFSVALDPTMKDAQGPDTGTQYRSEVFFAYAGAAEGRDRLHRPARCSAYLQRADRHTGGQAERILSGRGLSSGFPRDPSELPVYRLQRHAEGRSTENAFSGFLHVGAASERVQIVTIAKRK